MPAGAFGSGGGAEKSACRDVLPDGAPGGVRGDKRAVCPGAAVDMLTVTEELRALGQLDLSLIHI